MKRMLSKRMGWGLVLFLSLLPLINLLHPGLPVTHDGQDHVARIANFYQSLTEGNIIPRWAANLNWGYGHPILMFLYPLPSYIASFFHGIGFSLVDSTKLVFAAGFIAGMAAMYWWAKEEWSVWPGVTAAVLYGFAPYRFVDLYVRGDIGEHVAFVFLPVILWGVLRLSKDATHRAGFAAVTLGTALLILAHNALSIVFLPIAGLYGLYCFFREKRRVLFMVSGVLAVLLGFMLSAFFWIPAFFEGKYTLRDIVTAGQIAGRFVPFGAFIYSPWSYGGTDQLSKSLGWAQLVAVVISLFIIGKSKKFRIETAGAFGILLVSLFIMTGPSQFFWQHISLLQKFQFPWRFLSVSVAATSLLGGIVVAVSGKKQHILAVALCALAVLGTATMWHAHAYKTYDPSFFTGVYKGTTDTGESSPIWSVRFMEHTATAPMSAITGTATITEVSRNTTSHIYRVLAQSDTRLLENTLYFPGWIIRVDGVPVPVQFQDPAFRGLMTFTVPKGVHTVSVSFTNTKLRTYSEAVTVAGAVLLIGILGTITLWERRN